MLFCSSAYSQDEISCNTDEFTGVETCKTGSAILSTYKSEALIATIEFFFSSKTGEYVVLMSFASDEWQYLTTKKAYFLLDGDRVNYNLIKTHSEPSSGRVIEQYAIQLTREDVNNFVKANKVRFKISNDEYEFDEEINTKLVHLKNRVEKL